MSHVLPWLTKFCLFTGFHCTAYQRSFSLHLYWSNLDKAYAYRVLKHSAKYRILEFNYTEIPYWTHSCTNVYLERGRRWIASPAAGAECAPFVDTRQHLMPKTFTQTHAHTEQVRMAKTLSRHTICQKSWQLSPSRLKIKSYSPALKSKHLVTKNT